MEKPPIARRYAMAKAVAFCGLLALGLLVLVAFLIRPRWPNEAELIQNFQAKRAGYERLREMFVADGQLNRVTSYGVATTNTISAMKPEDIGFSTDRHNEYLSLLKQTGVLMISRREWEQSSDPLILVWVWGWGGHTKHVGICWKDQEPTNQVASLYQHRLTGGNRRSIYRRIDGHWYLWRD